MLSDVFWYEGAAYIVTFRKVDGQWRAALHRRGDGFVHLLPPCAEEHPGRYSDDAIRAGHLAVARWITSGGIWGEKMPRYESEPEQASELIAA
jgi:hypothetical protein